MNSMDSVVAEVMPVLIKIGLYFLAFIIFTALLRFGGIVRYISNSKVGIVEKLWSVKGSVDQGFIALNGEAGFQPDVLRGGVHFFLPFQYRLHIVDLVTIPQGQIGYVFARDGVSLETTQTLGDNEQANDFENVRHFLQSQGQKGPQRKILREGTYAINVAQFVIMTADDLYSINLNRDEEDRFNRQRQTISERKGFSPVVIKDDRDEIGVVTVHDGPSLATGEIIAPEVGTRDSDQNFHNCFQNPEKFMKAGGFRGKQLQVLVDGTYYINRLFATVELIQKTVIEVGTVGVVISYTGANTGDISGDNYSHGELVEPGSRGVWSKALLPGKYAFNKYAGNIIVVPTTNFVLKWTKAVSGSHKLDENLAEVGIITKDAFEPLLPLSVVVHIDYKKAPYVVQRFGDVKRLVDQTLDPMVSAYFKNIAQTKTLIQLIQERSEIQKMSGEDMKEKFANYNLELQEVLIGTPRTAEDNDEIEQILNQLRERQIAREKVETFQAQETAAAQERSLREVNAKAEQQTRVTASDIAVQIAENEGKAALAKARQTADTVKVEAEAEAAREKLIGEGQANRIKLVAAAEAERILKIGTAEAEATKKKVEAFGGPEYQLRSQVLNRFAEAIENSKVPIVPSVQVLSGHEEGRSDDSLMKGLVALLFADKAESRTEEGKTVLEAFKQAAE